MLILALESSAVAASAAIWKDHALIGETYCNTKQTHSQTLMPMVSGLLSFCGVSLSDLDVLAVSAGPGSFTGIRIGISCIKGMALPNNIPCCGISTLAAIAQNMVSLEGKIICAVMDARCGQVYNALFRIENGKTIRLCNDRAISIASLKEECASYGDQLVLAGDGAVLCHKEFLQFGAILAPETLRYQRASSVAALAEKEAEEGKLISASALAPVYLRLPQAERELKKKMEQQKG